jgi:hypothetical protein
MPKLDIFQPAQVFSSEPPDFSSPAYRLLAEGDSWFSVGALNPLRNSNLLFEMVFRRSGIAINCASPGDTLKRMTRINTDPNFIDLLCGHRQRLWDGVLISCGGNDLIEAVGSPPVDEQGQPVSLDRRLLRVEAEWGLTELGPKRYLSDEGWQTFSGYLRANFEHLLGLRDQGLSRGVPVFIHGYALPTPRPAGAGFGMGPWLLPSLQRFGIPQADHVLLAHELVKRLGTLLHEMADDPGRFPNLHFFDSTTVPVEPALPDTTGVSGDWINEIHLTRTGYRKVGVSWAAQIEAVLQHDVPAVVETEAKTTTTPADV